MKKFYYVTVATKKSFITTYTQWALKSLIKTGVSPSEIHFIGKTKKDIKLVKKLVPYPINTHIVDEDLDKVKWKCFGGKRKYSLLKIAGLYKTFPKAEDGRCMVYFDGDVLWYKNPTEFLLTKCDKTWFHHGKELEKRATIDRCKVKLDDVDSLSKWTSLPAAYQMVKYGIKQLPEREIVAGFYLLHEQDHEKILKLTYEMTLDNTSRFVRHEGAGDQKPMNAALQVLDIDWHGGSRFFCPEHKEYFDHFFGKKNMKDDFYKRAKKIGLM